MVTHTLIEAQASRMAGTTVTVQCLTAAQMNTLIPDTANYMVWGEVTFVDGVAQPVIHLRNRACTDLSHLNEKHNPNLQPNIWDATNPNDAGYGPMADLEDGRALEALVHEAMHIRLDSENESQVECAAYRYRHEAVLGWGIAKWKQDRLYWGMKLAHAEALPTYRGVC